MHALLLTENVLPSALCPTFSPGFYPDKDVQHIALEDVLKTCADIKSPLKLNVILAICFNAILHLATNIIFLLSQMVI